MALCPARALAQALPALLLAAPVLAHGGTYRGPNQPASGGGLGGLGPTVAAGLPGVAAPGQMPTTGSGAGALAQPELTHWSSWWLLNQAPYLALKEHVHSGGTGTGSDGWFLGEGQREQASALRPSDEQVRKRIVPALFGVLERERNNDLVTGAMIALAKAGGGEDVARAEATLVRFLTDPSQEIRETAAVSLGILASPRSIPILAHLLWDTEAGQDTVDSREVDYRTRSFAAYGLGLVGARAESELDRQLIVSILRRAFEEDDTRSTDLEVACLISLGLVPLSTIETPYAPAGGRRAPPESSRLAQLEYVFAVLRDREREFLVRAQCPVTLARLLAGVPEPHHSLQRAEIAGDLLERIDRNQDEAEIVQSCVLALGQIGTNDGKQTLDARIRRTLANVPRSVSDQQARAFALVAMAEIGARFGKDLSAQGIDDARGFVVDELLNGKSAQEPWAALAAGILCRRLEQQGATHPALETLRRVLRVALVEERSPERVGACALGVGLAHASEAAPQLMKLLEKELQDDARGQIALGIGLLDHREAIEPLRAIIGRSKYHPELLRQGAMALAILDDKEAPVQLSAMLKSARSLAAQGAIASALGFIGDRRSVDALLEMLGDKLATDRARAFAAVALGSIADKEPLPWNTKIGFGLNYRAAPATLSDPISATGILDLY